MPKVNRNAIHLAACSVTLLVAQGALAATTGFNQTGAGPYAYNDPANWVNGQINNIWDSSLTLTAAQTVTFPENTVWTTPAAFSYAGAFQLTLRSDGTADRTVTFGGDVMVNTGSNVTVLVGSFTGGQRIVADLGGATRTFDVGSSRVLNLRNGVTGTTEGVIKLGGGNLQYEAAGTYQGDTIIHGGTLWFGTGGNVVNSDVTVNAGAILRLDSAGSGRTSTVRTKSVTLNGGSITGTAATTTTAHTNDLMNSLTIGQGGASITATPTAARHMRFTATDFTRLAGGAVHFRGTGFGVNELASTTGGASNMVFTNAPTLTDGTAGTPDAGFIKGAFGSTAANGVGLGLVTYDNTYGVRLLNPSTEYKPSIDGPTDLNNIRLAGVADGSAPAPATTTLTSPNTTVASLSLIVTGTPGNAGVRLSGDEGTTLTVATGVIFGSQTLSAAGSASDYMTIDVPTLDLNGTEGVIIANTASVSNGTTGALMQIDSRITNDGGNGVTFGGTGTLRLGGAVQSDYTGPTYASGGLLWLAKTEANIGVPGDVVVNSGTLLNQGNQIPDTADITINGGQLLQKGPPTNSGTGASETFRDLYMTGGTYADGTNGTSSGTTNLRNAELSGGAWNVTTGHKTNVAGSLKLSGTTIRVDRANDATRSTIMTVAGDVAITNTASGTYKPFVVVGGNAANVAGGRLVLGGDLSYIATDNPFTTIIDALVPSNGGGVATIALNGPRTFTIGDGPAEVDLQVMPSIIDDGATVGALIKTGAGALALYGESTLTGGTTVNDGTLLVNGSLAGPITITGTGTLGGSGSVGSTLLAAGGTLAPGNSPGTLTIAGDLELVAGSKFIFDLGAATSDRVDVSGILTLDAQQFSDFTFILGTEPLQESYILFSSAGIVGSLGGNLAGDVGGNSMSLSVVGNDVILAIPEPGIAGLAVMVGLGALARRRPRRA